MADSSSVVAAYDRLMTSIGERAGDIGARPVVTHWPHVGSAFRGLVVVGQAVYGWSDGCLAADLRTPEGRAQMIAAIRRRVDNPEPLYWIDTHRVRTSPFWRALRCLVEATEPDLEAPWYARFAWVNLYPSAPDDPPGNPTGALKEAQDPHVGGLLRAVTDMLDARRVVLLVGPYWWPAAGSAGLADLSEQPRPLLRAGVNDGQTWVVGWHPTGASHRRFGPQAYAQLIADAVRQAEAAPG